MRIRLAISIALSAAAARAQEAPPDLRAQVDAYLRPLVEMGLYSGAVLLARDGRVVVEAAYGSADLEAGLANEASTAFKLMSVSKSITAVAVMRLAGKGKLDIADPVGKHLPDWPDGWRGVTVRQLLDHTPGIPNLELEWAVEARVGAERGLGVWRRLAGELAKRPLDAAPGTRAAYSNFNYVLLGLVLEKVAGSPYAEVLRAEVFKPAGMERTGIDDGSRRPGLSVGYFRGKGGEPAASKQDMSVIEGAGGFYSTVGDLYRLDRALRGDALLSREGYVRMVTVEPPATGYACGWQVSRIHDRACVHHSGGANGYVADFLRFPDDDACVVVLSNFAFAPAGRISHDLAGLLFGRAVTPARKVDNKTLDGWTGIYRPQAEGRALLVRRSGDVLMLFDAHVGVERCGGRLLLPLADDLFVTPWTAERLRFAANGLVLESGGVATTMERVHAPVDGWGAAIGEYATEPKGTGPMRIAGAEGRFKLEDPKGWPSEQDLLPLTETLAIALYSEEFGTLLHLDRGADGRVTGFRRQRNDGQEVRGARRDP
jgi:CubicO group peptidase (beta-lactamase class C family)